MPEASGLLQAPCLSASGDTAGGKRAMAQVIRDYPLSYTWPGLRAALRDSTSTKRGGPRRVARSRGARQSSSSRTTELFHGGGFARRDRALRQGRATCAEGAHQIASGKKVPAVTPSGRCVALFACGMPQIRTPFLGPRVRLVSRTIRPVRWRGRGRFAYPRPFSDVVEREREERLPAALAYAACARSAFDPSREPGASLRSHAAHRSHCQEGCQGRRHQLRRKLAWRGPTNVALGCRFLADLRAKFPDNPHLAISAYNAARARHRWNRVA